MEFSVRRPSPPNTYSYVWDENSGSTRKFVEIYLLFTIYVYFQPNSCNTHTEREWAQGTFLRQWRKVPPAHAQRVYFSIHLSVRLSGIWKHVDFERRNSNQGVRVEFRVRRPSPPNTHSFVREESSGSTRKFVQNYSLFMCISNLILAIHTQIVNGLEEPLSKTADKSSSSPRHVQQVYLIPRGQTLNQTLSGCLP